MIFRPATYARWLFTLFLSTFSVTLVTAQLEFVENKGQWDARVQYKAEMRNGAFFLQPSGFTVLLQHEADLEKLSERVHGHSHQEKSTEARVPSTSFDPVVIRSHAYRVSFEQASGLAMAQPDKMLPTYNNYIYGNDPARWQGNCRLFQAVTYRDMYPNIDVRYYADQGTLKYDFIVRPGGRISDIVLRYDGVDKLSIKNRELLIGTSVGEMRELYPYTYQVTKNGRETLDCNYVLEGNNRVRFKVKDYDPEATIVIDPTLIFCSFTGSTKDNWGYTATPGPDGSLFAGGVVFGSGFPVSTGAFQTVFNGGTEDDANGPYDIGIIKLSANGTQRLYATYIGGSGNEQPHSMICDAQGNLVIAGRTNSPAAPVGREIPFPVTSPMIGVAGKYDIFVAKLNANGTGLIGSLRMGGREDDGVNIRSKYSPLLVPGQSDGAYDTRRNYGDDARSEVILDPDNNIYLASCTQSTDFPVQNTNIQTSFGGGGSIIRQDGVIAKFSADLRSVLFSTFFGGSGNDACFVVARNPADGNIYVGGGTTSTDLPGDKTGVLTPAFQGNTTDGFVTIIRPDGSAIIRTTYIGTNDNNTASDGIDLVYGIQFDRFGYPYIMGTTTGNWLALNASFSNPGGKQFIAKLEPDLSRYIYTTMFGTNSPAPNISPVAFLVDRCQNVYVSGWGGVLNTSKQYPNAGTGGMEFLITPGAVQPRTDRNDFFFFVLEKDAASQLYGTFFGQNGGFTDHVDGGTSRFDANGIIYQAICANCGNTPGIFFPTTPGVWAPGNLSGACNEAAVKIEMNFGGVGASVKATINGVVDTVGCVPLTIRFTDTLAKGKRYIWHYGDGTRNDTTLAPVNAVEHTYTNVGVYRLMLVSIDSSTCNIADTAYVQVRVGNNEVSPSFTATKTGGCESLTFLFNNTTTAVLPVFRPNTFVWDFGDGTPPLRTGRNDVTHTYRAPGIYTVWLKVDDSTFCNAPDSINRQVRLAVNVNAGIRTPATGCVPYTAVFENASLGGTDFIWDFGDGSPVSREVSPSHLYRNTGTYTVRLTAIDTSTCNRQDDTTVTVTVFANPTAGFDASPNPGEANRPINFINASSGAVSYIWDFNDGTTSTDPNPSHLFNESRVFNVCLVAVNSAGCRDTICKPVEARVIPLLDVPTAFTPGRFGVNSSIMVTGFGIGKMDWRIYNRWGQLVFQTSNRKDAWDGTYKGKIQPMDVYTYTLDVEFTDGKKLRKTGDITLLR